MSPKTTHRNDVSIKSRCIDIPTSLSARLTSPPAKRAELRDDLPNLPEVWIVQAITDEDSRFRNQQVRQISGDERVTI
jgi:hypothetical protein